MNKNLVRKKKILKKNYRTMFFKRIKVCATPPSSNTKKLRGTGEYQLNHVREAREHENGILEMLKYF